MICNAEKLSKVGIVEYHSFRHWCTNSQQCRITTLPPKKKTIFNSANNDQELTFMNNLCFRTLVVAIKSAEVQHCRRNTKKLNSAEKYQTLALLNSFFLALLYPSAVLKHNTDSEKQKERLNSA